MPPNNTDTWRRAIYEDPEYAIQEIEKELASAHEENARLNVSLQDISKRRTQDRKSGAAERMRRIALDQEIKRLNSTITAMAAEKVMLSSKALSRDTAGNSWTDSTKAADAEERQSDEDGDVPPELENERLKSQLLLFADIRRENETLHLEKSSTAQMITDLEEKVDATSRDLKEVTKEHERTMGLSLTRMRLITQGDEERCKLRHRVDELVLKLNKYKGRDKKQDGRKRKLVECLKDERSTDDDLGDDEPQIKKLTPAAAEPATDAAVAKSARLT